MLQSLTIQAFKAFEKRTTIPLEPFTLLVGPNGSGKSTILQAIELLGGLATGSLGDHLAQHDWQYGDLPHLRSERDGFTVEAALLLEGRRIRWRIGLGRRRHAGIADERIWEEGDGPARVFLVRRGARSRASTRRPASETPSCSPSPAPFWRPST